MAVVFFRTIIMYLVIIIVMRFTGKRQIGELQLSELVVTILISELAAIPMQDVTVPVVYGVVSILTLISLEILLSFISLKSVRLRKLLEGRPSILINNGVIDQREMKKLRFTIDDLVESLRQNGVLSVEQVNSAILETNGRLSVFLKARCAPPTAKDLKVKVSNESLPLTVMSDGRIIGANLDRLGVTRDDIDAILDKHGIHGHGEVFYMSLDGDGHTVIVPVDKGVHKK